MVLIIKSRLRCQALLFFRCLVELSSLKILTKKRLDKKSIFQFFEHKMEVFVESVKVNDQGQIVVPKVITEEFGFKKGDEIILLKKKGYFILKPALLDPWKEIQKIMDGEAEKVGWYNEDDVLVYMKERRKKRNSKNANND